MRKFGKSAVFVFLALTLSACGATPQVNGGDTMSPDEAKAEVNALFASAEEIIGTGGWAPRTFWGPCEVPGREDEVQWTFAAQKFVSLAGETRDYGDRVAAQWTERGLSPAAGPDSLPTEASYLVSDPPSLEGLRDDGGFTQLSISPDVVLFRAKSRCVPGRVADLESPQG